MSSEMTKTDDREVEFTTFHVRDSLLGVDIRSVREINGDVEVTVVPHSPDYVRGVMNLRGEIVTVADLAVKLGLDPSEITDASRNVILSGEESPRFFVANRAHHADVGGISPGSMPISTHIDEEGYRIEPALLDSSLLDAVCVASRTPGERRGDLLAQVASLKAGAERMAAICSVYGAPHVTQMGRQLVGYSERIMRSVIGDMPDGRYAADKRHGEDIKSYRNQNQGPPSHDYPSKTGKYARDPVRHGNHIPIGHLL